MLDVDAFTIVTSLYDELAVSLAFAEGGAQLGALGIGVVPLTSDREALILCLLGQGLRLHVPLL